MTRLAALAAVVVALVASGCGSAGTADVHPHACAEDSWCWSPLIDGNHRGAVRPMVGS